MQKKKILFVVFLASYFSIYAQKAPTYSQYIANVEKKTAIQVNLKSHPQAKEYRSNLKEAFANSGANFGGKYILTTWGCGTGCLQGAIIDVHTGNVFFPLELQGVNAGAITLGNHDILEFRKNSNLLIMYGYTGRGFESETQSKQGIYYYQWNGKSFKLLKFLKKNV